MSFTFLKARRFTFYFLIPFAVLSILIIILFIQTKLSESDSLVSQQKMKSGVVDGRVIDEIGEPLPDYLVTAASVNKKIIYEAQTDIRGRFEFSKLEVGGWKISVKLSKTELERVAPKDIFSCKIS